MKHRIAYALLGAFLLADLPDRIVGALGSGTPPEAVGGAVYICILLGIGAVFQIPVVIFILARIGLVSAGMLLKVWKWAILAAFVLDEAIQRDGSVRTLKFPRVDPERCTGCGICETKCPFQDKAAIRVTSAGETRHPDNQPMLIGESDSYGSSDSHPYGC